MPPPPSNEKGEWICVGGLYFFVFFEQQSDVIRKEVYTRAAFFTMKKI
jgi:hypothetical protein